MPEEKEEISFDREEDDVENHFQKLSETDIDVTISERGEKNLSNLFNEMKEHSEDNKFHDGESIYEHTENVLDKLTELDSFKELNEKDQDALFLGGALHDIGKVSTKMERREEKNPGGEYQEQDFIGHSKRSKEITDQVLEQIDLDEDQESLVKDLVEDHHEIFNADNNKQEGSLNHMEKLVDEWETLEEYDKRSLLTLADMKSIEHEGAEDTVDEIREDFGNLLEEREKEKERKDRKEEYMGEPFSGKQLKTLEEFAESLDKNEKGVKEGDPELMEDIIEEVKEKEEEKTFSRGEVRNRMGNEGLGSLIGILKRKTDLLEPQKEENK